MSCHPRTRWPSLEIFLAAPGPNLEARNSIFSIFWLMVTLHILISVFFLRRSHFTVAGKTSTQLVPFCKGRVLATARGSCLPIFSAL